MTLATRTRHGIEYLFDGGITLSALYDVKGTHRRLNVAMWITDEVAADPAVVEAMLELLDQQAQEAALFPDDGKPHGAWM